MPLSEARRLLLDIQGFDAVDDAVLAETEMWIRLSPALCAGIAAAGTALASPWTLVALAAVAALGAALPFHPFDLAYNLGIRRVLSSPQLPRNRAPRRFACGMASAWLLVTGALFGAGYGVAGYVLGFTFVGTATLVATTHICLPSIMFRTACGQMSSIRPRAA
jgi:hypothetical protein